MSVVASSERQSCESLQSEWKREKGDSSGSLKSILSRQRMSSLGKVDGFDGVCPGV
jgi:hypothetical protein